MQLAIAREEPAGRIEEAARVVRARLARYGFQERARAEVDAALARDRGHHLAGWPGHGLRVRRLAGPRAAPGEDLGQHDQLRAARRGLANECRRPRHVRFAVGSGRHLHGGRDEALHACSSESA